MTLFESSAGLCSKRYRGAVPRESHAGVAARRVACLPSALVEIIYISYFIMCISIAVAHSMVSLFVCAYAGGLVLVVTRLCECAQCS